jgi:hypothetical protein
LQKDLQRFPDELVRFGVITGAEGEFSLEEIDYAIDGLISLGLLERLRRDERIYELDWWAVAALKGPPAPPKEAYSFVAKTIFEDPARGGGEARVSRAADTGDRASILTKRQRLALRALLELEAVDRESRRTAQDVATKAGGRNADAELFKAPLAELVRLGFVASRRGRGGGCWLTDAGKAHAEKR